MRTIVLGILISAATACASQSPDASTTSPAGETSETLSASSITTPALDVLKTGGTFVFALDESHPAQRLHEECNAESGGDAAKAGACYARIQEEAGREGIRFATNADGRLVWTSWVVSDGRELTLLEVPLAVTAEGDHVILGRPLGAARGAQAGSLPTAPNKLLRFEVPDATTVAMVDPDPAKGRLVFHLAR
jgi:hypothetical protein